MTSLKIHFANILDVNPAPIKCMSLNETTLKLALFRGGTEPAIELWDVSHLPFKEASLTDLERVDDNVSVESIVWVNDRLFSCGLHGFVLEHDLSTGLIKEKTAATSGPVWCLGVSPKELFLAAGTEDGFVNIFQVFDDCLVYLKVLDRQEGRHLCLSWSPCGKYIATGSIDSLRLWDVEKGHALQRLMTGRAKNTETIVWSVLMLDDFLIVTGDSRGIIGFWDGRIGVLKYKIFSHKADILSLKLSPDQNSIYAAGVDPLVVLLSRVGKSGDKWVKSHQRNMHMNDVMCLATHGNRLFSAGVDADLVVSSFPPKIVTKYPPMPPRRNVVVSRESKQVLIQNGRGLDIWKLPGMDNELVKLLELGISRKQDVINSTAMSPSGTFFAYSTDDKINFFRLSTVTRAGASRSPQPKLVKLSAHVSNEIDNLLVSSLLFMNESLVLALSQSSLSFIEINEEDGTFQQKIRHPLDPNLIGGNMISLAATGSNSSNFYLAISNCGNSGISVLKFQADDLTLIENPKSVPKYRCQPTAIAFHPTLPYLLIAYVDHSVKVFNFSTGKIIYDEKLGKHGLNSSMQPVLGASWCEKGERAVLHEVDKLYLMKLDESLDPNILPVSTKRSKKSSTGENSIEEKLNFSIQTCENKYKFLAFVGFLDDGNELLVVEVKPSSLLEKLPSAFAKKRFGM